MPDVNQVETQERKQKRHHQEQMTWRQEQAAVLDPMEDQLLFGPEGVIGQGSADYQVARMSDPRLAEGERHWLAGQVGRVQGNVHLQRVIASARTGANDEAGRAGGGAGVGGRSTAAGGNGVRAAPPASPEPVIDQFLAEGFFSAGLPGLAPAADPPPNDEPAVSRESRLTGRVQPKLSVNPPDDPYEQEADRVADTVMRMASGPAEDEECEDCGQEAADETRVQAEAASGQAPEVTPDLEGDIQSMQGRGDPLPDSERQFFESRMGQDFSQVRVHTDGQAVQSSQDLNAKAFTVGSDIAFGAGEFQPGTDAGRRLLAHELTHVVQQGGSGALVSRQVEDSPKDSVITPEMPVETNTSELSPETSSDVSLDIASDKNSEITEQITETQQSNGEETPPPQNQDEPEKSDGAQAEAAAVADEAKNVAEESIANVEEEEAEARDELAGEIAAQEESGEEELPPLLELVEPPLEEISAEDLAEEAKEEQRNEQSDFGETEVTEPEQSGELGQFAVESGQQPLEQMADAAQPTEQIEAIPPELTSGTEEPVESGQLVETESAEVSQPSDVTPTEGMSDVIGGESNFVMRKPDPQAMGETNGSLNIAQSGNGVGMVESTGLGMAEPAVGLASMAIPSNGLALGIESGDLEMPSTGMDTQEDYDPEAARAIVSGVAASLQAVPGEVQQRLQAESEAIKADTTAQAEATRQTIQAQVAQNIATTQSTFATYRSTLEALLEQARSDITSALEARTSEAEERGEIAKATLTELFDSQKEKIETAVEDYIEAVEELKIDQQSYASGRIKEQAATARSRGEAKAGSYPDDECGQAQAEAVLEVAEETAAEIEGREEEILNAIDEIMADIPPEFQKQGDEAIEGLDEGLPDMLDQIDEQVENSVKTLENQAQQAHQNVNKFGDQVLTQLESMERATVTRIEGMGQEAEVQISSASAMIPQTVDAIARQANEQINQQVRQGALLLLKIKTPEVEAAQSLADQMQDSANGMADEAAAQLQEAGSGIAEQFSQMEIQTAKGLENIQQQSVEQLETLNEMVETRLSDLVSQVDESFETVLQTLDESFEEAETQIQTQLDTSFEELITKFDNTLNEARIEITTAVNEGLAKNDEALQQLDGKMNEAASEAAWRCNNKLLAGILDIASFVGGLVVGIVVILALAVVAIVLFHAIVAGLVAIGLSMAVAQFIVAVVGLGLLAYGVYSAYQARIQAGEEGGLDTAFFALCDMVGVTDIYQGLTEEGLSPWERGFSIGKGVGTIFTIFAGGKINKFLKAKLPSRISNPIYKPVRGGFWNTKAGSWIANKVPKLPRVINSFDEAMLGAGSKISGAMQGAKNWFKQFVGRGDKTPEIPSTQSPYQIHIDPKTRKGPMGIDTSEFTSGIPTREGGIRNSRAFWKSWSDTYSENLSPENLIRIKAGRSPVVDDIWIQSFPEHAAYKGETIIHHHINYGDIAIPLPESVHSQQPGWSIWHQ